jgi:hypothetical protein
MKYPAVEKAMRNNPIKKSILGYIYPPSEKGRPVASPIQIAE